MSWSSQQSAALKAVGAWLQNPGKQQVFRLFGYAGTGKTTLAKEFASGVKGDVLFGAFTGKAAHVMHKKGCTDASTVHSMIYRLDDEQPTLQPRFSLNQGSAVKDAALVIIDECSMVDEQLGNDLLSFRTPVLVLGAPAQSIRRQAAERGQGEAQMIAEAVESMAVNDLFDAVIRHAETSGEAS